MRITHHEAHAPAGHVVAFAHGEELDGNLFGALHLHDARRLVAIEAEVGVGKVMHDPDAMLFGQCDDLSKNGRSTHMAVGFDGNPRISIFGFGKLFANGALDLFEEIHVFGHAHAADVRTAIIAP